MSTTFYHGTTEPYGAKIFETQNFLFSNGEKHLLGRGIYLYKDPIQAKVWARMKADYENSKPLVLEVDVDVNKDDYLDLDTRSNQNFFFKQRQEFLSKIKDKSLTHVESHYTDSHFCDFLVRRTNDTIVAKTFVYALPHENKVIPVRYTNQKKTDRNITRHYRTEKQYCIKDHALIKNIGIIDL